MNITGRAQKTIDRFDRMEDCLRHAGITTNYRVTADEIVLEWERTRNGIVVEYGHLFAIPNSRTGNLRFCGGTVSGFGPSRVISTYREAWSAVGEAIELARRNFY